MVVNRKSTLWLVVVVLLISAAVIFANLPKQSGWIGGLQDTISDVAGDGQSGQSGNTAGGAPTSTPAAPAAPGTTPATPGTTSPNRPEIARPSSATLSHVAYVHDGDTLYLQPDGTSSRDAQIKVRLIGLDTPEVGEFGECFGTEARDYLRKVLPEGTAVWIKADAEPYDKYGRALLYLWTTDDRSVNLDLVEKGYATALSIAPSNTYAKQFARAEAAAYKAKVGMWGSC